MDKDGSVIIKIGGSLIERAPEIIRTIRESRRDALIIPGGGLFADTVRQKGVSGTTAHFMAIAAMDQYGWLLSDYGIPVTRKPSMCGYPCILLPYSDLLGSDPLPHSWDVTSDTISAYYAGLLSSPLIILKSIEYIRTPEGPAMTLLPGMLTDDIDQAFLPYVYSHGINGQIIQGSNIARLMLLLKGEVVPGTWFGSTI